MGAVVGSSVERLRWGRTAGSMEVRDWPSLDVELEASLVVFEREEDSTTALPFAGDFRSLPMVGRSERERHGKARQAGPTPSRT